jgi:D-glycero-D-manno-heptose 1,7-bisphosphate phosphatase
VAERPAVFLDRDGTVIADAGYPRDPAEVTFLPGAVDALRRLGDAGFALVVVSNQSGIGRGLVTQEQADAVHRRFLALLAEQGIELTGAFYCPHAPDEGCECRKPAPGLICRAAAELSLDLGRSYMVGDKQTDVETGRRAGCEGLLLPENGNGWDAVARVILQGAEA